MLAQRALDRKLTSELGRFQNLMSSLTGFVNNYNNTKIINNVHVHVLLS